MFNFEEDDPGANLNGTLNKPKGAEEPKRGRGRPGKKVEMQLADDDEEMDDDALEENLAAVEEELHR